MKNNKTKFELIVVEILVPILVYILFGGKQAEKRVIEIIAKFCLAHLIVILVWALWFRICQTIGDYFLQLNL